MTPRWREWLVLAVFALCLATGAYLALEQNAQHHPISQEN
ncbi:hypothetical protein QE370_000437 [Aeromicrobium sp. SORGH_AS981]|nr:hypothetical protein [Aeromicrobium sp. SORGH_AS_0981]